MAFFRRHADQEVVVFHNLSDQMVEIDAPEEASSLLYSYGNAKWEGGKIKMTPYSSIILEF
jgi:alpha-amylase